MAADVDFSVATGQERAGSASVSHTGTAGSPTGQGLAWAGVLLAFALFNETAYAHLRDGNAAVLGVENGALENAQLLAMLPALGLFWYAGLKSRGPVGVVGVMLALVVSIGFVRELELKTLVGLAKSRRRSSP